MEFDFSELEAKGISVSDGLGFTGGKEKYVSALQRYYKAYEGNKAAVEELLDAGKIEDYGIKVHSLKSNSRMIGANDASNAFEELEMAARNGDEAVIRKEVDVPGTGPS